MATSTVNIPFTITAATQIAADAARDNGIVDYCKAYGLDVYVIPNVPASGVDNVKALAAWRAHVRQHVVSVVQAFRASAASVSASASTAASTAAELA